MIPLSSAEGEHHDNRENNLFHRIFTKVFFVLWVTTSVAINMAITGCSKNETPTITPDPLGEV